MYCTAYSAQTSLSVIAAAFVYRKLEVDAEEMQIPVTATVAIGGGGVRAAPRVYLPIPLQYWEKDSACVPDPIAPSPEKTSRLA